jgi:hypothetical protein
MQGRSGHCAGEDLYGVGKGGVCGLGVSRYLDLFETCKNVGLRLQSPHLCQSLVRNLK